MALIITVTILILSAYVAYCDYMEDRRKKLFSLKAFMALLIPIISVPLIYLQEIEAKRVEKNISPWVLSENEKKAIKEVLSKHKVFEIDMYYVPAQIPIYQEMVTILSEAGWTVHEGNGQGIRSMRSGGGSGPPIEFGFNSKNNKELPESIVILKEAFSEAGLLNPNKEGIDFLIDRDYTGKNISMSFISKPYLP